MLPFVSLVIPPPMPVSFPAKVVVVGLTSPMFRMCGEPSAERFTVELATGLASERIAWSAPLRSRKELPAPASSKDSAVRPLAVGSALATLALKVEPLRMKVAPL